MVSAPAIQLFIVAGALLFTDSQLPVTENETTSEYFEGRWAFAEETCDAPTNWTLLASGNFISDDLTGTWQWAGGKLSLQLIDLAMDEETGETGGRFQMEGPVTIVDADNFSFLIEPDVYQMKRCL